MDSEGVITAAVSADGTPIAHWRSGAGPPLVLVHGTTADHGRWRPVLPLLEPRVTVYAVDRRGRGGSGDAPDYAIEHEFADIAAVLREVASDTGQPVDLLGHSYGALCALGAARIAGNAVRRMVLYEPPAGPQGRDLSSGPLPRLEELVAQDRPEEVVEVFFREEVGVSEAGLEQLRALPPWRARVAAARTIPREMRGAGGFRHGPDWFANITTPTLLLLGGESPAWAVESVEQVRAALPDARVEVLPGQQHVAMDTAPELFATAVMSFLSGDR